MRTLPKTAASLQRRSLGQRPARATPMFFDLGHLTAPSCTWLNVLGGTSGEMRVPPPTLSPSHPEPHEMAK